MVSLVRFELNTGTGLNRLPLPNWATERKRENEKLWTKIFFCTYYFKQ